MIQFFYSILFFEWGWRQFGFMVWTVSELWFVNISCGVGKEKVIYVPAEDKVQANKFPILQKPLAPQGKTISQVAQKVYVVERIAMFSLAAASIDFSSLRENYQHKKACILLENEFLSCILHHYCSLEILKLRTYVRVNVGFHNLVYFLLIFMFFSMIQFSYFLANST